MNKKVLIAMSGGLDSTTLAYYMMAKGYSIIPVFFNYGSKHNPYEWNAIQLVMNRIKQDFPDKVHESGLNLDITSVFSFHQSSLMMSSKNNIPEGHYNDETMKQTVVPGRNLTFIAMMAGIAESKGYDMVAVGAHSGDHYIYPDCRPRFFKHAKRAVYESTEGKVTLAFPFLHYDKAKIVRWGLENNPKVPYDLTRTCYKNQADACGKCGACQERKEAFIKNNTRDLIRYETDIN